MRHKLLFLSLLVVVLCMSCSKKTTENSNTDDKAYSGKPNILFLTSDDLNFDSVGVYGSNVENATPHIDALAKEGLRFEHAYVQAPSCAPSRNAFITGHYPHNNGVEGFFSVDFPQATLPEALRQNGYFTGVIQKVIDMTPTNNRKQYWDYVGDLKRFESRTPANYGDQFDKLITASKNSGKPFFASVNVQDPHLPFFRTDKTKEGFDNTPPSVIFQKEQVPLHPVLPQFEEFEQVFTNYYNTVKRGDDAIGEVMKILDQHNVKSNTLIVYISDHGMSFPFVKSNLYPQSVRTPWIMVWPGKIKKDTKDTQHMISAIDLMPTLLDITNTPKPGKLAGQSLVPILEGKSQPERDHVFVEHSEGPTADPRPMRAIHTKDYAYIFNAWGTGDYLATMECRWYSSYNFFRKLSKQHDSVKQRFDFLNYRTVEELYDTKKDPYAKNNLINDPAYATVLNELRDKLEQWMRNTNDYALDGFLVKDDITKLRAFMEKRVAFSKERATRIEWKRWVKHEGRPKGKLTALGESNLP